jgi:hypothetical protein
MDLWEMLVVTFRRWKISLPVLVVLGLATFTLTSGIAPTYKAQAGVIFVGSSSVVEFDPTTGEQVFVETQNPVVTAGEARTIALGAQKFAMSTNVKLDLARQGFCTEYAVILDRFQPIIDIEADCPTPEQSIETARVVVDQIDAYVEDVQIAAEVPEDVRVGTAPLFVDEVADEELSNRLRAQIILAVFTLVATIGAAVAVDALIAYRQRRRAGAVLATQAVGAGSPPEDDDDWVSPQAMIDGAMGSSTGGGRQGVTVPPGADDDPEARWGRS